MLSFYHYINKYTVELGLASRGWKFDENGKIGPVCEGQEASKDRVLSIMYNHLKDAPVYYLSAPSLLKFIQSITDYTKPIQKHDSKQIQKTLKKIKDLVQLNGRHVKSCFQGEPAKEINVILDKNPAAISEYEYQLLSRLANFFAFKRRLGYEFYKKAAIIEKMNLLRKECPNLYIEFTSEGSEHKIKTRIPTDTVDLQFWLILEFYGKNNPKHLNERNPEFIKEIVKRKVESTDPQFKQYLNSYLTSYGMASLCENWDRITDETQDVNTLDVKLRGTKDIIRDFDRYTAEFIHEPPAFTQLFSTPQELSPHSGEEREYGKIAKELFEYANDTNKHFDRWYAAIYNKIATYQSLHPEAELPLTSPEVFCSSKDFTDPRFIKIPILQQIRQWEEEEKRSFEQKQKSAKKKSIKPAKKPASSTPQKVLSPEIQIPPQLLEETKFADPTLSVVEVPSSDFREEQGVELSEEDAADKTIEAEEKDPATTVSNQSEILKPPVLSPSQKISPKRLKKLLQQTSPFKIEERILAWFDPDQTPIGLNEESRFIHNFAWASNEVLWRYGMRYPRENKYGIKQPAIAMLCQIDQATYKEKKLFRVTLTFDHNTSDPSFAYDSSLVCYHRTLTQREQNQNDVEEYIRNGKYQFIDFPSLPSHLIHLDLSQDLIGREYPDGSFVESVKGSVITIRDPKNDERKKPCRIYFFVVR